MNLRDRFFIYNGRNLKDFQGYVKEWKILSSPEARVETFEVSGRDGELTVSDGTYSNASVQYECFARCKEGEEVLLAQSIKQWLTSSGAYHRLEDTKDPNYYRLARTDKVDINSSFRGYLTFTAGFTCLPYRYRKSGERWLDIGKGGELINQSGFSSLPLMRVYGYGTATLIVNKVQWILYDIDEYVDIDSEMMNSYKGGKTLNSMVRGKGFPILHNGQNSISITGKGTKIEVKPRWRTL